ncbi:MAG TPA: serine hydrolase, partial [Allosphingosinicella sp.]
MKRLIHMLAAIATVAATPTIGAQTAAPPVPRTPAARSAPAPRDLELFIDGIVQDAMRTDHIAGVAVAVADANGPLLLKGYGQADVAKGIAVDPERTLFRIGSLSKTFTWILLMREVERGRVRLDAPVNDYLPAALRLPDAGFKKPVRVADLMMHGAGFEDNGLGYMLAGSGAKLLPLEEYLARYRPRRVREAGVAPAYSNYGAALAGAIVAHLNGIDYPALVERDILAPLGISGDATFREPYAPAKGLPAPMPAALAARVATGYSWAGGTFAPHGFEYISNVGPAGSGSASAAAIARYMQAQLAGGAPLYGPAAAKAFRTPMSGPWGASWAHGYMVSPLAPGLTGYGHAGATGFFLSNMVLIPDMGIGIFVATNTDTGRPLATRLPELVAQYFGGSGPIQRKGDPSLAKKAKDYAGVYLSTRRTYAGLEGFITTLGGVGSVRVSPDGYLITQT